MCCGTHISSLYNGGLSKNGGSGIVTAFSIFETLLLGQVSWSSPGGVSGASGDRLTDDPLLGATVGTIRLHSNRGSIPNW